MSISSGTDEIQTVYLSTDNLSNSQDTTSIDAQEDREIIGYSLRRDGGNVGDNYQLSAQAFVGVDPDVGNNHSEDLGGKFFASMSFVQNGTAGWAHNADDNIAPGQGSWDWNEDSTLTLAAQESEGGQNISAAIEVYYRVV